MTLSPTHWLLGLLSPPSSLEGSTLPESPSYLPMFRCPKDFWSFLFLLKSVYFQLTLLPQVCLHTARLLRILSVGCTKGVSACLFGVGLSSMWVSAELWWSCTSRKPSVSLRSCRAYLSHLRGSLSTKSTCTHIFDV